MRGLDVRSEGGYSMGRRSLSMEQDVTDVGHYRLYAPQKFGQSPYYQARFRDLRLPESRPAWWSTKQTVYKHAKTAAIAHIEDILSKETKNGGKLHFKTAFEQFLAPQTNHYTKSNYENIFRQMKDFHNLSIDEVTTVKIEDYFQRKLQQKDEKGNTIYAKTTLQTHFSLLRSFFNHCVELDLIAKNPCKQIIRKRWLKLSHAEHEQQANKFVLTMDNARHILNVAKQKKEYVCKNHIAERIKIPAWVQSKPPLEHIWRIFFIGFLTGWRISNILSTKFRNLDLDQGIFTIPANQMKSGRTFIAPIHPEFLYWARNLPQELRQSEMHVVNSRFSPSKDPRHSFDYIVEKAGFPDISPHSMRHSYGRWLSASLVPEAVKDALMDHHRKDISAVYGSLNGNIQALRPYVEKLPWLYPLETPAIGDQLPLYQVQGNPL